MKIVTDFPRKVKEIENLWIELSDGVKLAARIWLPEDAEEKPVPAILEYLPYRKRDGTIVRDAAHPSLFRRPRLCGGARRHARQWRFRRADASTNMPSRSRTTRSKSSTGWPSSLVHRQGRHDRHLLGRLQRTAGRGAQAAGTQGGRSRCARRMIAMPTTSITRAAASSTRISAGRRPCSPIPRARPIPRSSASAGATCGSSGSRTSPS